VARVVQQVRTGLNDPDVVVGRALETVGPPSLYTAVVLSLGFSAMMLSRFPGLQMLGLLCMVALLIGFAADAMLTTTFIKLFFNWGPSARTVSSRPPPRLAVDEEAVP
jgi:predicted RND superfamily exporter protein